MLLLLASSAWGVGVGLRIWVWVWWVLGVVVGVGRASKPNLKECLHAGLDLRCDGTGYLAAGAVRTNDGPGVLVCIWCRHHIQSEPCYLPLLVLALLLPLCLQAGMSH